jgi:oligopeptide transport system ATP-binding protein
MSLLEVESLTKSFPLGRSLFGRGRTLVQAIRGVSLSVAHGETLGLVGESGCGKSTLGRCIIRLIEPTTGRVVFDGADLLGLSDADMRRARRDIQIIFQDPYSSLDPRQRVGEIILEGLVIHDILKAVQRRDRVIELLESVGLKASHVNSYPHEFSGGQRQRIAIARALAVSPKFLIADEAVSALDVSIQAQILNLFMDLQRRMNLTYLFISHNLHVVRHISDRVAVMYLGRIVEIASAQAIYSSPQHPYTKALLSAALLPNPSRVTQRLAVRGEVASSIAPPPGCAFHTRCPIADDFCWKHDPALKFSGTHGVACHKAEIGTS